MGFLTVQTYQQFQQPNYSQGWGDWTFEETNPSSFIISSKQNIINANCNDEKMLRREINHWAIRDHEKLK